MSYDKIHMPTETHGYILVEDIRWDYQPDRVLNFYHYFNDFGISIKKSEFSNLIILSIVPTKNVFSLGPIRRIFISNSDSDIIYNIIDLISSQWKRDNWILELYKKIENYNSDCKRENCAKKIICIHTNNMVNIFTEEGFGV